MFLINDMPSVCPHCGETINAQESSEDFFAGATVACPDCGECFRYLRQEDCPHTVYCSVRGCLACGSRALHGEP
jgi:endogenous inhibitor of DNA gyrase (YacG/DUF329 family)